jgi:hypothetical protein
LDLGNHRPRLLVGGSDVTDCGSGLAFNDNWVLRVRAPEPHSNRWRLSARFFSLAGQLACEIRNNELIVPAVNFEIEQFARTLLVRSEQDIVLELELLPPAVLAINRYSMTTSEGVIFIGRRSIPDPLTSIESLQSVIDFQHNGDGRQTLVDCSFRADVGLNLCISASGLVMRNQLV